ncbi:cell division FtsZ family protein [bacterium]|nr:cell division FtsZ family protein [bacterium]
MTTKKKTIKKEMFKTDSSVLKDTEHKSLVKNIENVKKENKVQFTKKNISSKTVKKIKNDDDSEISTRKVKIKVIGVGGGGSNIVLELSKKLKDFSSQKIEFIAANTDSQALRSISKSLKIFQFGSKVTNGLGCGSDVSVGEKAAREDLERIKTLFSDGKDLYIIVSSFGGGTGTGAAPVFAKIASDLKLSTLSIFTLPFSFEGKKKMDYSNNALEKLKEYVNAYMVLPNEKIFSFSKEELSFSDALGLLNDNLSNSLEGLFKTIYNPGLINVDWADIKTVLEGNKKIAYLDMIRIKGGQNLEEFAKSILKNPILDYNFEDADNIIFNIEGSKDLSLQTLSQISEKISEHVPNARIIFGLSQNQKLKNEIKIAIFATISDSKSDGLNDRKIKKDKIAKPVVKDGVLELEIDRKKDIKLKKEKKEKPVKESITRTESKTDNSEFPQDNKKEETKSSGEAPTKEKNQINEEEKEVRRNALQAKEIERLQREQEDSKEKMFDIPAFLRKEKKN